MLPRWHIIFGVAFTFLFWIVSPETPLAFLSLLFLSSFLIDFDHYMNAFWKTRKPGLKDAFDYHKKELRKEDRDIVRGIKRKGDFHIFHTIEFHTLIGVLAIFFSFFFYVFIGMVFHSLLDVFSLLSAGKFHRREYFFFNWIRKRV